jgi:acyl dehydratase
MVPVGSRVRARSRLLAVEPRGGGMQLTSEITIEIEGQKRPALVTESIGILFK